MDDHDIDDKILIYLFKFRNDSDFHDLFEHFEQCEYDVIWDKVSSLYDEKIIEYQPEFSFGDRPFVKHELSIKLTKHGIDYVKNNLIRQAEIETLKRQKITDDKNRFRINIIISIVGLLLVGLQIYLSIKLSEEKKDIKILKTQRDSLSTVTTDQFDLLKIKDNELMKMKTSLDSLFDSLKFKKQLKKN